jgi:hypothetical protein
MLITLIVTYVTYLACTWPVLGADIPEPLHDMKNNVLLVRAAGASLVNSRYAACSW